MVLMGGTNPTLPEWRPVLSACSYAALLADWPVVVLGLCTLLIVVCALVGVLVPELPDFSDPLLVRRPGLLSRSVLCSCCCHCEQSIVMQVTVFCLVFRFF